MVADPGNIGSGVAVEKLYCQACGSSSQYPVPWLLPMMAEICVAVGSSDEAAEGLGVAVGQHDAVLGRHQVAAAVGRGHHADDRVGQVRAAGRAVEARRRRS